MNYFKNISIGLRQMGLAVFILSMTILFSRDSKAATGTASTGIWNLATTWVIGGINRLPTCGDTLTIPAGVTVTVNSQQNYTACVQPMFLTVRGRLDFLDGFKLDLPCNSSVVLTAGGRVRKTTPGGGSSTYIHICGCVAWEASQGTVNGPDTLACSTLPVSLLYFTGKNNEDNILLSWATATEINNDHFTIERSVDGIEFEFVTMLRGSGNSDVTINYSFTDEHPHNGLSYYRLVQTDFDGSTTYYDPVAVRRNITAVFNLLSYFTDDHETLIMVIENDLYGTGNLKLYSLSGSEIYSESFQINEGNNHLRFQTHLQPGCYLFVLDNGEKVISGKVTLR
jgi:hypothetical protein